MAAYHSFKVKDQKIRHQSMPGIQILGWSDLITRAGLPATTAKAGTSFVTTLPAPIRAFSPMVMPHKMSRRTR